MCIFRILIFPLVIAVLLIGSESSVEASDDPILIIANNSFGPNTISQNDVKRIFRKEKTRIGSQRVVPIHAKSNTPLRKAFLERVMQMSPTDETSYWEEQKVISGLQPPAELGNTVRAVFSVRDGISYCFKSDFKDGTAKILLTI